MINVAVIGSGFGRQHIDGFARLNFVRVLAIGNRTGIGLDELAAKYKISRVVTDYRQVLDMKDIDAVTIATPVHLHKQMVLDALDAGKHVLSEKPLALNAADARTMFEAAERSGRRHMTNFGFRFTPASFHVEALLREGAIGKPFHVNIRHMIPSQLDPAKPLGWRHVRALAGFGALGDLGVHNIDLLRWWLGDFERVAAVQRPLVTERILPDGSGKANVDVDDVTMAIGELKGGVFASIHVSRCSAGPVSMEAEIAGSDGSIRFDRKKVWFAGAKDSSFRELPTDLRFPDVASPYATFAAAMRDGVNPAPSFFDGWRVQEVADAILRSGDANGDWQVVPKATPQASAGQWG